MVVAPVPVILLIVLFELRKIAVFAMVLFCIDTIRLIFLAVPCMVVIVLFVVIGASGLLILGAQSCRGHCNWGHQGGTQQSHIPETRHDYSSLRRLSNCRANHLLTLSRTVTNLLQIMFAAMRSEIGRASCRERV